MPFKFNPFTNKLDEVDTTAGAGPVTSLTPDVGGPQFPTAGNINILGGTGITTVGSGSTITINAIAAGFIWHTVTSATNPNAIAVENGYITAGVAQVNFTLPAVSAVGDMFIVTGYSSLFQIQQGAGQVIYLGSQTTTAGVGGTLTSTMIKDHVGIVCVIANLEFKVIDSVGNLTVV